ncbi:MAG TPA: hypothetical protein DEB20_09900 [Acidimicrobiaceae bacterium]|nr:hypothetical protein [Acidimicrobiaceae bacterium]
MDYYGSMENSLWGRRSAASILSALCLIVGIMLIPSGAQAEQSSSPNCSGLGYTVARSDEVLVAFDLATGAATGTQVPTGSGPQGMALSADGSTVMVAAYGDDQVEFYDAATLSLVDSTSVIAPIAIAVNPVSGFIYVSQDGVNQISILDPTSNAVSGTITTGGTVNEMTFTPDGSNLLAVESLSSAVEIFDQTGTQIGSPIALSANPNAIAVTPDGTTAYISATFQNKIIEIDLVTLTQTDHSVMNLPLGIAVSPDGQELWVPLMGGGQVQVFSLPTFTAQVAVPAVGGPAIVMFAPGTDIAYVTAQLSSTLTGISTVDYSVVSTEVIAGGVFAMALCPTAEPEPTTTTTVGVDPVAPSFTG